jgi:hypothetical protein
MNTSGSLSPHVLERLLEERNADGLLALLRGISPIKINRRRRWRLPRCDSDFDSGIRAEIIAVKGMMFSEPVPNTPPNFAEKIDAALFPQVSEIADQVCEGVFVNGAAALLKNRERLGGRGDVFGFIDHASPLYLSHAVLGMHAAAHAK